MMVFVINGNVCEYFLQKLTIKSPFQKGVDVLRRIISFFELPGTCAGFRSRAPIRPCNTDLIWRAIPIVTDNQGDDYILNRNYTAHRPISWMLQELDFHNLTNNIAIMSGHRNGDSALWSLSAGKAIRYPPIDHGGAKIREFPLREKNSWYANIREKGFRKSNRPYRPKAEGVLTGRSLLKGSGCFRRLKLKNMTKLNEKWGGTGNRKSIRR